MFGIKKKGRYHSQKFHSFLQDSIRPFLASLFARTRYPGRIRLMNRWGRKHPRKLVTYYCIFAFLLLGWNVAGFFIGNDKESNEDPLKLKDMANTENIFSGMAVLNRNREAIQSSVSEYAETNIKLYTQLDSLLSLKIKTREDSLEIVRLYRILNSNSK